MKNYPETGTGTSFSNPDKDMQDQPTTPSQNTSVNNATPTGCDAMSESKVRTPAPKISRRDMVTRGMGVAVVGGCYMAIRYLGKTDSEDSGISSRRIDAAGRRERSEKALERELRRLRKEEARQRSRIGTILRQALDEAEQADAAAMEHARQELEGHLKKLHVEAIQHAGPISENLGSFRSTALIIGKMAKDKVWGSRDLDLYVERHLGPVNDRLMQMVTEAGQALAAMEHELDRNTNQVAMRVAAFAESVEKEHGDRMPELKKDLQSIQGKLLKEHTVSTFKVGFVVVEAGFITKSTINLLPFVVNLLRKHLGKWALRATVTATASATMAAADGPLPVLDAVALLLNLGFLSLSIMEIRKTSKSMPGMIERQITSVAATQRDSLMADFNCRLTDWLKAVREAREEILRPFA